MKKRLLLKSLIVTLLFCLPFIGNAQRLLTENFDYEVGSALVGQGNWVRQGSSTTNPLSVVSKSLTYPGYQETTNGKAIEIKDSGEDIYKEFSEQTTGSVYYSALVNLTEAQSTTIGQYFLHFGEGGGATAGFSARLWAKKSANGKLQLTATRTSNASSTEYPSNEYEFNETHLVIVKYTFNGSGSGGKDDRVDIFINPIISDTEPEPTLTGTNTATYNAGKIKGVYIRQGTSGSTPLGYTDAIRVSTTWEGLFGEGTDPGPDPDMPAITLTGSATFGEVYVGESYTKTVNVKGENLKGNILLSGLNSGEVSISVNEITKEQAQSEDGFDLVLTLEPTDIYIWRDTVYLNSEDAVQKIIPISWGANEYISVGSISELKTKYAEYNEYEAPWILFKLTGEVLVSHKYDDSGKISLYVYDDNAGMTIYDGFGDLETEYVVGDKLTNIMGTCESMFGTLSLLPKRDFGAPVSQDNEIPVQTVTLAQLKADSARYESRLVKVENVLFYNRENENEGIFTQGTNNMISQDGANSIMRVFKGADFISNTIPEYADITGISTSGKGNVIAPRSTADIIDKSQGTGKVEINEPKVTVWAENSAIKVSGEDVQYIDVYNFAGSRVAQKTAVDGINKINLQAGAYFVKVTTDGSPLIRKVLVK